LEVQQVLGNRNRAPKAGNKTGTRSMQNRKR